MSAVRTAAAIGFVVGITLTRRYYKDWVVPAAAVAWPPTPFVWQVPRLLDEERRNR